MQELLHINVLDGTLMFQMLANVWKTQWPLFRPSDEWWMQVTWPFRHVTIFYTADCFSVFIPAARVTPPFFLSKKSKNPQ